MVRWFGVLAAALLLAGCATEMTRRYAGQPVQAAIDRLRAPDNIYDLADGRRVFAWTTGDAILTNAPEEGFSPSLWTENVPAPEGRWRRDTCQIAVFARWSAERQTWVVVKALRAYEPSPPGHCGPLAPWR